MFCGCTSLTLAPEIAVTTLGSESSLYQMFYNCTSLVNPPSRLPATTLTKSCYNEMFRGCTSLTSVPLLPATTLAQNCYYRMFYGCTNLSSIKCLATNISATSCLYQWVNGVAASGTFVKDPNMTSWPSGVSGIPSGWTVQDAILFTIDSTTYYADANMTWGDWVDSSYNVNNTFTKDNNYGYTFIYLSSDINSLVKDQQTDISVTQSDTIINGNSYYISTITDDETE